MREWINYDSKEIIKMDRSLRVNGKHYRNLVQQVHQNSGTIPAKSDWENIKKCVVTKQSKCENGSSMTHKKVLKYSFNLESIGKCYRDLV